MNHEAALQHLRFEAKMAQIIAQIGAPQLALEADAWRALSSSIIGQQISVHAARAIRHRFAALGAEAGYPTPLQVLALDDEALRGVGLSRGKVLSLRDLALHFADGRMDATRFALLEDEAIIGELIAVRGIGRWTAQMFLLFSLGRPDVWAVDDLGLRAAVKRLHALQAMPDKAQMQELGAKWAPFRSLASWYLWRWLENAPAVA